MFSVKRNLDVLVNLFFPPTCPICDEILTGNRKICEKCVGKLPLIRQPRCMKCGKPLEDEYAEYCSNCKKVHHRFVSGECTFLYATSFRDSVLRMKFQNRREYLDFYAEAMAAVHAPFLKRIRPAVIVPVPMHKRKRRERGFDQCLLLAEKLSARTGIPVARDAVIRVRYTKPQKELTPEERMRNLDQAFRITAPEKLREPLLLLDDIYTTGATMDAFAGTFRSSGFREIYFLALCTTRSK